MAFERAAGGPGRAARGPHVRVERLRIFRIEGEVDGACVVILVENFLPAIAAIGGTEDAAFGVGAVGMAEDGDEDAIGILRVDDDIGDLLAVAQTEMFPGVASVGGFVNSVARGKVGTAQAFAAAYVNNVGIRRRYGERADRAGGLVVEDGKPGATGVGGLPHAAIIYADVEEIWFAGDAGGGYGAASPERADTAPFETCVEVGRELRNTYICIGGGGLRAGGKRERSERREQKDSRNQCAHLPPEFHDLPPVPAKLYYLRDVSLAA